ncbi:MAG: hypothetical protein IJ748_03250 [Bacteroidales bacterium]|nr:hypothetical protein [Bacteroidales bacterium]
MFSAVFVQYSFYFEIRFLLRPAQTKGKKTHISNYAKPRQQIRLKYSQKKSAASNTKSASSRFNSAT